MVNRRTTAYVELKSDGEKKQKDASIAMSFNVVVPKEFEGKKLDKFLSEQMDNVAKNFKKWVRKREEKEND